ncbi:MAG: hypothetical protein QNL05_00360 [Gammaproteobacteria bacterium]|nr:hypothetical protein [Gammaproteobacteria bacterium]
MMELKAGLGGRVVTGQTSEVKIHLFATRPVTGELEISDANGLTIFPVQLDERREKTLWLPVTAKISRPVEIKLITNRGEVIEKKLSYEHGRTSLTLISRTIPAEQTFNSFHQATGITPVILSAAGLPHIPQAYAGVNAIVSDPQSMSSLSQDQYHALAYYLSRCNIMLLSGANHTVLKDLQSISGCGGRFIQSYQNLSQVRPMLLKLSAKRPPKTPAAQDLMPLRQPPFQQQMITSISLYLGGYIFFFTLVSWRVKKTHYLLLVPALVTAAGILIWTGEGSHHQISWAETESGDNYNKLSSLLMLGGNRRGENRVTIDTKTRVSNFIGESQTPSIHYLQDADLRKLSGFTHLLSPQAYHLTSSSRQLPRFQLSIKEGQPEVIFLGEKSSAKTRLLWRGHTYKVPVLSRDERWQPEKTQAQDPVSLAERLLNRHLAFADPALLLPFSPELAEADKSNIQTTGWQVIRHNPEQNNLSPNKPGQML